MWRRLFKPLEARTRDSDNLREKRESCTLSAQYSGGAASNRLQRNEESRDTQTAENQVNEPIFSLTPVLSALGHDDRDLYVCLHDLLIATSDLSKASSVWWRRGCRLDRD